MKPLISKQTYEILRDLGLSNLFAGMPVEDYGVIIPEVTITEYHTRPGETFYDIENTTIQIQKAQAPSLPDMDAIIVLHNSSGAPSSSSETFGHGALLIGSEEKGWTYISKDQYEASILGPLKSPPKYIVKKFSSYAQFKASAHNYSLQDEYSHSTTSGKEIDSLDYRLQLDSLGRKTERYDKAMFIPTDSVSNMLALRAAIHSAKESYVLMRQDCSHVVTQALRAIKNKKIKDGENTLSWRRFMPFAGLLDEAPEVKFESIKERNPNATEIE